MQDRGPSSSGTDPADLTPSDKQRRRIEQTRHATAFDPWEHDRARSDVLDNHRERRRCTPRGPFRDIPRPGSSRPSSQT
jgi:hypothetical protein